VVPLVVFEPATGWVEVGGPRHPGRTCGRYRGDCLGASSALSSHIFPHILVHGFVSSACMASARSAIEEEIVMVSLLGVS